MTSQTFSQHSSSVTPNIGHLHTHNSSVPVDAFADTSPIQISSHSTFSTTTMTTTRARARLHKRNASTLSTHHSPNQPSTSRRRLNSNSPTPNTHNNDNQSPIIVSSTPISRRTRSRINNLPQTPPPQSSNNIEIIDLVSPQQTTITNSTSTTLHRNGRGRGRLFRPNASQPVRRRLAASRRDNITVLARKQPSSGLTPVRYLLLESDTNVVICTMDKAPSCTCNNFTRRQYISEDTGPCKHIIFVFLQVLKVQENDPVWWQVSLLQQELQNIFNNAPDNLEDTGVSVPINRRADVFREIRTQIEQINNNTQQNWDIGIDLTNEEEEIENENEDIVEHANDDTQTGDDVQNVEIEQGNDQMDIGNNQVDTGSNQINTGSNQIITSLSQVDTGSNQINIGSNQAYTGSNQMNASLSQAYAGSNQMNAGLNQVYSGSNQINTGSNQVYAGSYQVNAGSNQVYSGSNQTNAGTYQAYAGADHEDPFIQGLGLLAHLTSLRNGGFWTAELESYYTQVNALLLSAYGRTSDPQLRSLSSDIMANRRNILANQTLQTTRVEQPTSTTNVQEVGTNINRQREESRNVQTVENGQDKENADGEQKDECIICLEAIEGASGSNQANITFTCSACSQVFHKQCLDQWWRTSVRSTCPHCRQPYVTRRHRSHNRPHLHRMQRERTNHTQLEHRHHAHHYHYTGGSSHEQYRHLPHRQYAYNHPGYISRGSHYTTLESRQRPRFISTHFVRANSSEDSGSAHYYSSSGRRL